MRSEPPGRPGHPGRRPGRKRSAESRAAILSAALELFGESGYPGLTVEGIAARAGCGKQTIYRWWPSKADVLLEALAESADLHIGSEGHGSYRADLRDFLVETFTLAQHAPITDVLRVLMAETQLDPAFGARFRAGLIQRRRDALGRVLARAAERGDLPPGLRLTTVLDLVFGILWYRLLAVPAPMDDALVHELLLILTGPAVDPDPVDLHPVDPESLLDRRSS